MGIRRPSWVDVIDVAINARDEEVAEVFASTGRDMVPVLVESVEISSEVYTLTIDGKVACLWGVSPVRESSLGEKVGSVWLISTPQIEKFPRMFWKQCIARIPELFNRWDVLINAIDVRHEKAIRWAERLGFQLSEPAPYGHAGLPFREFVVRKGNLKCATR